MDWKSCVRIIGCIIVFIACVAMIASPVSAATYELVNVAQVYVMPVVAVVNVAPVSMPSATYYSGSGGSNSVAQASTAPMVATGSLVNTGAARVVNNPAPIVSGTTSNNGGIGTPSSNISQTPIDIGPYQHILDTEYISGIGPASAGGSGGSGGFTPLDGFGSGTGITPGLNPGGSGGSGGFNPLNDPGSGTGNNQGSLAPNNPLFPANDFQLQDSMGPYSGGPGLFNKNGPGRAGLISSDTEDEVNGNALHEQTMPNHRNSDGTTPTVDSTTTDSNGVKTFKFSNGDTIVWDPITGNILTSDSKGTVKEFNFEPNQKDPVLYQTNVQDNAVGSVPHGTIMYNVPKTGYDPETGFEFPQDSIVGYGPGKKGGYESPDMPGGSINPSTFDTYYVSRILKSDNLVSNPNPEGGGGHDANVILPAGFFWIDPNPDSNGHAASGIMTPQGFGWIDPKPFMG